MENSPTDFQKIIALLEDQNKTLHALLNFQLIQEKKAFRRAALGVFFHAIPYIAIIIVGYFLYQTLHNYLDQLNNNINAINNEFTTVKTAILNIPNSIQSSVQSGITNLNPFK